MRGSCHAQPRSPRALAEDFAHRLRIAATAAQRDRVPASVVQLERLDREAQEIALGHDAAQHAIAVDDGQAAERVIEQHPAGWVAQPTLALSTMPTLVDGALEPRHVDLRPFVLLGPTLSYVTPGGLTRVARGADSLIVNSSQGGGSKDTWVVDRVLEADDPAPAAPCAARSPEPAPVVPPVGAEMAQ